MPNLFEMPEGQVQRRINERHNLQERETEDLLIHALVDEYPQRRERYWDRDYSSMDAYLDSVEPNRERWRDVLGRFEGAPASVTGGESSDEGTASDGAAVPDAKRRRIMEDDALVADELSIKLFEDYEYRGRGLLAVPKAGDGPYPLVVGLHGAGSSPEKIFGFEDENNAYKAVGRTLAEEGYAVLAPRFVNAGGSRGSESRRKFEVLLNSIGKSLFGLEVFRVSRFLDYLESEDAVDLDRVAAWGNSMGGATTLFLLPAEERVDAGICSSFFNDRLTKHVLDEPRYSQFRPVSQSTHFFIPGWFREFSDADLTSLICPRPFMVQAGIADDIDWRPYLREEFERASEHYERLGVDDRIELLAHDDGHEIKVPEGIEFLDRHL